MSNSCFVIKYDKCDLYDHHIDDGEQTVAVCLTKEEATRRCNQFNKDNPNLEPWYFLKYDLFA